MKVAKTVSFDRDVRGGADIRSVTLPTGTRKGDWTFVMTRAWEDPI